ncbi:MAG TPA: DUF445 domain-containing protein [Acinetobacter ursingii]|jgi:uncharacterized membrane-anchored protein YjiN (DUF445 family)|uniref:DUF445 domain-containing protein n=4 Tax=Gammaproteobacteria TaxID=1236 RepID=N9D698_9GAMM|nr:MULTISPECIES: DUF445 domain-containing protein [Acinetobacter]NOZ97952.1 DUF445 family protein [Gammaproteobacteria bacterium]ENV74586.1 hypothetical protein F944_03227 [Acinetobacter ursingii DSM 16037 = CIP 107286]ENV78184.1 hypothetical protein F942_03193 [Acinetobacter ursingii ANC 3649]ENX49649.1 hypothetical protein F943_01243 [Acinetobacter ursingii NIPH 706]EXD35493.1 hypothetical protein J500_1966 [Acinetobacter sp. 479375]
MQVEDTSHSPSLSRSKRYATIALLSAVVAWIILMVLAKFWPEYAWIIHILMLSAEAGVVGGLADWYAITVLFRNPFGKIPIPKFLLDHTEIIPRNKTRIAESMGRFVQENFLSPQVVERSLNNTDLSLAIGQWLANPKNSNQIVQLIQQTVPKLFEFVSQEQIARFIQTNSVQWVKNTQINSLASEMLRAVLENDFHQDVLQRGLDLAHEWIVTHPDQARELTRTLFKELGVWKLAKGASWIGIDVQQRTIDSLIEKVESMLADPEHPWRQGIEQGAQSMMLQLADSNSEASRRLNEGKNALLDSPQVLNFISGAVVIFCNAIKQDLLKEDSGIAQNLRIAIEQIGQSLIQNRAVREVLNEKMTGLAISFSDQYSDKIIRYISERIHEWDSREMIAKIENEVGGDLHMIRVNGVVVGAFIGLVLGIIRALVDYML